MNPALTSLPSHFHSLAKLHRLKLGRHQIGGISGDLGGGEGEPGPARSGRCG